MPQKPITRRRRLKRDGRAKMIGVYVSDEQYSALRLRAFEMEEMNPEGGNVSLAQVARKFIEEGLNRKV